MTEEEAINKGRQRSDTEEDDDVKEGSNRRRRLAIRTSLPTPIQIHDASDKVQLGLYQHFKNNKHFR